MLDDPRISPALDNCVDWKNLHNSQKFTPRMSSIYNRYGNNTFPFKDDIKNYLDMSPPTYDPNFNQTFSDITDNRGHDLLGKYTDRPWIIMWSGGIDSTTVLTSILKNTTPADRNNIYVACNRISVYENPRFFYDHIRPNFKLLDSTFLKTDKELLNKYYVMSGEFSDQLHTGVMTMSMFHNCPNDWRRDVYRDPDLLINFIADKTGKESAVWYYDRLINNIKSTNLPIENYHDFFWWIQFNVMWAAVKLRPIFHGASADKNLLELYNTNFISWFENSDYQQWAMCNNHNDTKYGNHIGEYKCEIKKYIYEFDRNEYYQFFKTKEDSHSRRSGKGVQFPVFCILDDLTCLNLDDDLDRILELLPNHVA